MNNNRVYNINKKRLLKTIDISATYGKLDNGGLCRLALSKDDRQMRDLFAEWMEESNLDVRFDDVGNMYGRRHGKNTHAAPIVIGSHLDTQKIGGKYDGILGVMGALEVIRTLNDHNIETERPIEIVNFTNEEGARFLPSMLGSAVITNKIQTKDLIDIKDKDDLRFLDELKKIKYNGLVTHRLNNPCCYIELHIEQGPVLENCVKDIGVVTGIQGISNFEIIVQGKTSHSGTTPMKNRIDAMLSAAKMIQDTYNTANNVTDLLITVGKISSHPNVTNSIAEQVTFSIDVRHPEDNARYLFTSELKKRLSTIAIIENVDLYIKDIMDIKAEIFSTKIINAIQSASENLGYSTMKITSGAGHDAKHMNSVVPSGMIFIPSVEGISHNENEFSTNKDVINGVQLLLEVVLDLSNKNCDIKS